MKVTNANLEISPTTFFSASFFVCFSSYTYAWMYSTVYIWESSTWRRGNGNRFSLLLTGSVSGSLFTPTMHTYMEGNRYLHKHTVTHLNKNNINIVFLTTVVGSIVMWRKKTYLLWLRSSLRQSFSPRILALTILF